MNGRKNSFWILESDDCTAELVNAVEGRRRRRRSARFVKGRRPHPKKDIYLLTPISIAKKVPREREREREKSTRSAETKLMSAYGFGSRETDAKNGVIGRWQYHHSETRDALASAEKASTEYERCCSNSGGREVASVEEKVRSKNIFERELERFRDALEKLENCLTMGYARVIFSDDASLSYFEYSTMGSSFGFRGTREFVLTRISLNLIDIIHCFSFSSRARRTRQGELGARLCRSTESFARVYREEAVVYRADGS